MTATFRKAITSEAKPLIGLQSVSGCGKTKSALLLACGFVGGDMSKVGMIETESGRGEAYADDPVVGGYSVLSLREDFAPKRYGAAIAEAERASIQALIVDSASHEWEGVGGVLAMAAANQAAGRKGPLVWQQPKMDHAREFMLRLTQTPIPLVIVCMRAKYPMYEVTAADLAKWEAAGRPGGKPPKVGEWARSWILEPKQSEDILFEMFVHGWIDQEHRFHGSKYTLDVLRTVFLDGEPVTVETGKRLAVWATGRTKAEFINTAQSMTLEKECGTSGIKVDAFLARAKIASLDQLPAHRFDAAVAWIKSQAPQQAPDEGALLLKIDKAKDRDEAAEILDRCRELPFYERLSAAFTGRWAEQ